MAMGAGLGAGLLSPGDSASAALGDVPALPPGVTIVPLDWADIPGWSEDDLSSFWPTFVAHARAASGDKPVLRAGMPPPAPLTAVLRQVADLQRLDLPAVRNFLEQHFRPLEIIPPGGHGFLTGYYEPLVEGSLTQSAGFTAPLLARPASLVTIGQGETLPGIPEGLAAAKKSDTGFEVMPTRAAIEAGALKGEAAPLVWLRDSVEVFLMQVQGSGRVRLADGRLLRLAYAGRNGHPYTSIGRILVEQGHVGREEMSLERLKAWLRANPEAGRAIMQQNASYIFFRIADELPAEDGPIGGAGLPLTAFRSIAVDRTLWPYGLPVWLDVALPGLPAGERFRQLTLAEDTGSAILGPARADLFHGTGDEAGRRAGLLRHPMRFIVLWPNPAEARP